MCSFLGVLFKILVNDLLCALPCLALQSRILTHSLFLQCTDEILRSSLDLDIGEHDLRFNLCLYVLGSMHDDLCGSSWGSHHRCTLWHWYRLKLSSFLRSSLPFRSEIGSKKCNLRERQRQGCRFFFLFPTNHRMADLPKYSLFLGDGPLE